MVVEDLGDIPQVGTQHARDTQPRLAVLVMTADPLELAGNLALPGNGELGDFTQRHLFWSLPFHDRGLWEPCGVELAAWTFNNTSVRCCRR